MQLCKTLAVLMTLTALSVAQEPPAADAVKDSATDTVAAKADETAAESSSTGPATRGFFGNGALVNQVGFGRPGAHLSNVGSTQFGFNQHGVQVQPGFGQNFGQSGHIQGQGFNRPGHGNVGHLQGQGFGKPGLGHIQPNFAHGAQFPGQGFVQQGSGHAGHLQGQGFVQPGFGQGVGHTGNTGFNLLNQAPPSSCRFWCKNPQGQAYCCENAHQAETPVFTKAGLCPPVRPSCPPTRSFGPPNTCSNDGACGGVDKCCFDTCLQEHICKPPRGIGR